ncbi:uncharacterized protein LOC106880536 isoform X2 [Octopus bimaculoides]|uniref:uncharacterized protein LOC106880536 isoform X2 n=1 Tax=Octopus bimaculoides TaxID=37653 RepID=UPI00071CEB5D|nr:uncharacterized protein LOC106880536 isoform X2 [Octopus bimaculoides]|eukprot:XP_014786004.1 PREDICTED: uncharacterized protein LOC106880536 isoform X2 [Octopus bimaculoides]
MRFTYERKLQCVLQSLQRNVDCLGRRERRQVKNCEIYVGREIKMVDPKMKLKNTIAVEKNEINPHEIPAKLKYMHRPPRITPNYGNKRYCMANAFVLKTKLSRVLLYDNVTQQFLLGRKLNSINSEQEKVARLCDLHRKTFFNQSYLKDLRQHHFGKRSDANMALISAQSDPRTNNGHFRNPSLQDFKAPRTTELPPLRTANSNLEQNLKSTLLFKNRHQSHPENDSSKFGDIGYQRGKLLKLDKRFLSLEKLLTPFT